MTSSSTQSLLSISDLYKAYGALKVLNGVNLDVAPGEVVVVIGPSGCGKSTLLRCVNGLEPIGSGTIRLDGEEITSPGTNWSAIRQRVGMVFQDYELFPHMNVLDNILLAPMRVQHRKRADATTEAEHLLNRVGLIDKRQAYPRQLSGGQKQRIAIVRSLILHPELMLFDEVTAALDPEMVREVLDCLVELAEDGLTMLIVTHEMGFARAIADQVLLLDQGRVAELAGPEQFFTHPQSERAKSFLASLEFTSRRGSHA